MLRREFMLLSASAALTGSWRPDAKKCTQIGKDREVPWLDAIQQNKESIAIDGPPLSPLLINDEGRHVTSLSAWKKRRTAIRKRWLNFTGFITPNPEPPELKIIEEDYPTGVVRQLVEYEGEPGIVVQGYLIKPNHIEESRPGVLTLHSTTDDTIKQPAGIQGEPEKAFGLKLAQLGYVTFSPENFLWHNKGKRSYAEQTQRFKARHPNISGMAKMLFDASRGLDVLQSLPIVDSDRMGVMGHSLGGKEALYLAAFDARICAAVSSEGGISTHFSNWDAPWYLGKKMADFDHDHHELLALVAPGPFLLIGGNAADGPKSWRFIKEALSVYKLYEKPYRIGLLNHKQGHSVPSVAELRSYQWLLTYL